MQGPDRVAIRERDRTTTYAELVAAADRLAGTLADAGLATGDRVAIWLPSRAETAVAVLACQRNGYVAVPSLHRDHTVGEVVELMGQVNAVALIWQRGYGADADRHDIESAVADSAQLKFMVAVPSVPAAGVFEELAGGTLPDLAEDPNAVCYLAFTSGTTGAPKGVMHSHNTLLSPVRALVRDWSLDQDSRIYSMSPLSHNLGFGAMLLALVIGAELTVHDLPRGGSLVERLRSTGATFAFGVPTHAIDLLAELEASAGDLPQLRGFRISGAAVPPVVAEGLLRAGVMPQSGYGMTEAGSHHYTLPTDEVDMIVGTSGRACDGVEVRIVDTEDPERELEPGQTGQIVIRGASLTLGYFDDQQSTERSFNRAGWFLTGDLGWRDEQGYLRITGRKKDVIIRGGHNIFPARIENLVLRHPAVARAAAIAAPDERLGERVCLVVQLHPGEQVEADELLSFLDEVGLSKYDMPEYYAVVPAMPLLPSGKVFKRRLVDQVTSGEVAPSSVRFVRQDKVV